MEDKAVQLKILLKNSKPPIWRRVLVNSGISFYELHFTIQLAMGWANNHVFEFEVDDYTIGEPFDDLDELDDNSMIDSELIFLEEVIAQGITKIDYNYDMGDFWQHSIQIEEVLPLEEDAYYPLCIKGKGNCPPEDCGGIPGFNHLLEVLKNKKHPEHESMLEWIGSSYDPQKFDLKETNFLLQDLDAFMEDYEDDTDFF